LSFEAELKARADQGDAQAQFNLGLMYATGEGVPKDAAEAVKWYRLAADQNHPRAQFNLGLLYATGEGVPKDTAEAVKWYRKAADQGDAWAQSNLGLMYADGDGVPKDAAEAVKWYRMAADQGHAQSQFNLGLMYATGEGVPKDAAEAVKWYRKGADQGHALAQCDLGLRYANGEGVTKDAAEAVKWLRLAADQGNAWAQAGLGDMHAKGEGVPKDAAEAVKWLRLAADQGNAWAQFSLGRMYANGEGVPKDTAEAVKWYCKAADQGAAQAQCNLGRMYYFGEGVPKDVAEAVKWFRQAADQGDAWAQSNLGFMYAQGQGVPKDDVEAYKWYNLSAAGGMTLAAEQRAVLERQLSRAEIVEGQRRAAAFVAKKGATAQGDEFSVWGKPSSAGDAPKGSATGFFITEDGYLVTSEHVVKDASQIRLVTSAGLISAQVVKVNAADDLALLKVAGRFAALPVASSRAVRLGSTVGTVGFPNVGLQGFAPKLAKGEIAALSGAGDDARYFQISVPVQPGNSGGALVDERGNVVGVVSAKLSASAALQTSGALPENVNYAIKSSYLLSFLESVPEVSAKLKEPNAKDRKFEDVVKAAEQAALLVLVY
jgi:TPR repeat protein